MPNLNYEEIVQAIKDAPPTQLPGLLSEIVQQSIIKNVKDSLGMDRWIALAKKTGHKARSEPSPPKS